MDHVERLSDRTYLAVSPVDVNWDFDPAAMDAAAGEHVELSATTVTQAFAGRTLIRGLTTGGDTAIVRLMDDGRLDATFGDGGVARPGVGDPKQTNSAAMTTDAAGYTYVNYGTFVTRLRANGKRDVTFGRRGVADLAADHPWAKVLDLQPDQAGGVDAVLTTTGFTVRLVHLDTTGTPAVTWERPLDMGYLPTDLVSNRITYGHVMRIRQAFILFAGHVFERDLNIYHSGDYFGGEATAYLIGLDGQLRSHRVYPTGGQVNYVSVDTTGQNVEMVYGGNRRTTFFANQQFTSLDATGTDRRKILATPNLDGKILAIATTPTMLRGALRYTTLTRLFDLSLPNVNDVTYGNNGAFSLDGVVPSNVSTVFLASAQRERAVIAYTTRHDGGGRDLQLIRLWTSQKPTATLISASATPGRAVVKIRYQAQSGIIRHSINSQDIRLQDLDRPWYTMNVYATRQLADRGVDVTYVVSDLPNGLFDIDLAYRQIESVAGFKSKAPRLGQVIVPN